jgi:hypothetical protein
MFRSYTGNVKGQSMRLQRTIMGAVAAGVAALGTAVPAAAGVPPGFETVLIDPGLSGLPSTGPSTNPAVSQSALLVAFHSRAKLVPSDTTGFRDVYVKHRGTGAMALVSVSSTGVQANADSQYPSIDATGAYIAFESFADNLVPGDSNGRRDIFLRHTPTGSTTLLTRGGNDDSGDPAISGDSRLIAFTSSAGNLVADDDNGARDVFVADRVAGTVTRVSVRNDGEEGDGDSDQPAISLDGRYVAYSSSATNLVSSDSNRTRDVFVHDRQTGTVSRVSVKSNGKQVNGDSTEPSIALRGDGYVVAFTSTAPDVVGNDGNGLTDVFVRTSQPRLTVRISVNEEGEEGNGDSSNTALSGADLTGAQYVAYSSRATNLIPAGEDRNGDEDVFRYDLATGQIRRFSVDTGGIEGTGDDGASGPAIDRSGHTVAYSADFFNFERDDGANTENVFVTVDHGGT